MLTIRYRRCGHNLVNGTVNSGCINKIYSNIAGSYCMIKPAFDILTTHGEENSLAPCTLLLELSEKQFTCAWVNKSTRHLVQLRQYHIPAENTEALGDLLEDLVENDPDLQREIKEVVVIYNLGETSLMPDSHYTIELGRPAAELVAGAANKGLVLSEKIPGHNIYTIYQIPRNLHTLFQRKFSAGKYWHYYTLLLSRFSTETDSPDTIFRLFYYPDKLVVAVFTAAKLQLMQSYYYQLPEDIAFHLLNICKQLNMDPEQVRLYLSGLIDSDSAMYNEISRYFLNIEWETTGSHTWANEQLADYPAHYFSPILQMALCV